MCLICQKYVGVCKECNIIRYYATHSTQNNVRLQKNVEIINWATKVF
jgi:hypothetical protein